MYRKVLFATLAVLFIVSLCFFAYNRVHATVTCSASASANSLYSSGTVTPGIRNLKWKYEKNDRFSGTATVRAACGGDVEKKENVEIHIRVKERAISRGRPPHVETEYELYTESKNANVRNWGMPSTSKIGYATGSISGASDTDRAEYHSSGYYN